MMRFVSVLLIPVGALAMSSRQPTERDAYCHELCQNTKACREDPQAHDSYCKEWQTVPVCFGLYWTEAPRHDICYHSSDGCSEKMPMKCKRDGDCQRVCQNVEPCHEDAQSRGSYCQKNGECFGLYYRSSDANKRKEKACFQPNDKNCQDTKLPPVHC